MKSVSLIGALLLVALSSADTALKPRGCLWNNGGCPCPAGTHRYSTGCGYRIPEATCRQPNPVPETVIICDYTACYCDAPTVRDQNTDQCVLLENCSRQNPDPKVLIRPPQATIEPPTDPYAKDS